MLRKKISIIGRGTAGVISALKACEAGHEVEWKYDSNIPPVRVGEGSTLLLSRLLSEQLYLNKSELEGSIGGSAKDGILKEGWGTGERFTHWFPAGTYGLHFDSHKLHEFVVSKLSKLKNFSIDPEWNGTPEDVDAKLVVDCRGTPNLNSPEYQMMPFAPVNRATVWQCPWSGPRFNKTITFARPHGWVFGIPLQERCAIGYVHNKEISSEEEISQDVEYIFDEFGLANPGKSNVVNFSSYKKNAFQPGRVLHNGNQAFFLEPLEANSTAIIGSIAEAILYEGQEQEKAWHLAQAEQELWQTETMIALHYAAGSSWSTDFWEYAQDSALSYLRQYNDESLEAAKSTINHTNEIGVVIGSQEIQQEFGTWAPASWVAHNDVLKFKETIAKIEQS